MDFHTLNFILFYGLVALGYFVMPGRWRWAVLLPASYFYFWTWNPAAIPALVIPTLGAYLAGIALERAASKPGRTVLLGLSLAATLGLLTYFKYLDFLISSFQRVIGGGNLGFVAGLAPIGISFYSLQLVSYAVDVYRGTREAETHLGQFALYAAFFPQLVAGPIARAKTMLPQYKDLPGFLPDNVMAGLQRVLWGAYMKFVIADRLAPLVTRVFEEQRTATGWPLWVGMYLFSAQIYGDFAGYSNMAIGIAKILGITLPENFRRPYGAGDITEFWNRWHISLSTWLRDYIFYPVMRWLRGRGIRGEARLSMIAPPLVTMAVSGIWHGAGWNFIVWGLIHGGLLVISTQTARARKRWSTGKYAGVLQAAQVFATFQAVTFAWVFFRATSTTGAINYLKNMLRGAGEPVFADWELILAGGLVLLLVVVEGLQAQGYNADWLNVRPGAIKFIFYLFALFLLLFLGNFEGSQPFIYAQF